MAAAVVRALHAARLAEREQAAYYRALAACAEAAEQSELSERLNGLHADEQHHFSRLTVRLMELGESPAELRPAAPAVRLEGWEARARERERLELRRYTDLLAQRLDHKTRHMLEQFMAAEREHEAALGGKWMGAEP